MSAGGPGPERDSRALTVAHRAALTALAACAAIIAAFPAEPERASPPAVYPAVALALGIAAIGARQVASRSADARVRFGATAYALAAAIGGVGVALVVEEGQRQIGLLYALGGAILALRPPSAIAPWR